MALSLKIFIEKANQTRTLRFVETMSVFECCQVIREKTGHGGADHGLFQKEVPNRTKARWLRMNRTLQYYELESGDTLEFKKKHRMMKIKTLDGSIKTVLVDDTLAVQELVAVIGEKLSLRNPEEFSLMVESDQKGGKEVWLKAHLTLHEQGIGSDTVLLLKKKFFVTDANVDTSSPFQLHFLYVQCQDAIVQGKYPCKPDEAIQFAAIQCQVVFGDYNPSVHKVGFLTKKLDQFVAPQWRNLKDLEQSIMQEHKKFVGMSEVNAKYRYVQLCRSLSTYGITFFDVKEQVFVNNKRKLIPVRLGITRDQVLRMDPATNEVVRSNKLSEVRRWASSQNTFTLDFGEYENDYLTYVTKEGEEIGALLAGYIDIILKRRLDSGRVVYEDNEYKATAEDLSHIFSTALPSYTSVTLSGIAGHVAESFITPAMHTAAMVVSPPMASRRVASLPPVGALASVTKQSILPTQIAITDLPSATTAVQSVLATLTNPVAASGVELPVATLSEVRHLMQSHSKAIITASGQLVEDLLKDGVINKPRLAYTAKQLAMATAALASDALAAVPGNADELCIKESTRVVADAIGKLLEAANAASDNPKDAVARDRLAKAQDGLKFALAYANASSAGSAVDVPCQKVIIEAARAVAMGTSELAAKADTITPDPSFAEATAAAIEAAKAAESAGEILLAQARVLAPLVLDPGYRQQMAEAVQNISAAVQRFVEQASGPVADSSPIVAAMLKDAEEVQENVKRIQNTIENAPKSSANAEAAKFSAAATNLLRATAVIIGAKGEAAPDTAEVDKAVRQLLTAANVQAAGAVNEETAERINKYAKALEKEYKKFVEAAAVAKAEPTNEAARQKLVTAANALVASTQQLVGDSERVAAIDGMCIQARAASAAVWTLINAARAGTSESAGGMELRTSSRVAAEAVGKLLDIASRVAREPGDAALQDELIHACQQNAPALSALVAAAKMAATSCPSPEIKSDLRYAAQVAGSAIEELLTATTAVATARGSLLIDSAMEQISASAAGIEAALVASKCGLLKAPSGQSRENATELLAVASKAFASTMQQLVTAVSTPTSANTTPGAASAACGSQMIAFASAIKAFASTLEKTDQPKVLSAGKALADESLKLIAAARAATANPADENLKLLLALASESVNKGVGELLNAAQAGTVSTSPVDEAVRTLEAEAARLSGKAFAEGPFLDHVDSLTSCSKALSAAATQVVESAKSDPEGFEVIVRSMSALVPQLVNSANAAAATAPTPGEQETILKGARDTLKTFSELLRAAHAVSQGKDPSKVDSLVAASETVTNTIKRLVDILMLKRPGAAETAAAASRVQAAIEILESTTPVADLRAKGKDFLLGELSTAAKALAGSSSQLVTLARTDPREAATMALRAAAAVEQIILAAKATAPSATSVQRNPLFKPAQGIEEATRQLVGSIGKTAVMVKAIKGIVSATSELVTKAKEAATTATNPDDRRRLLEAAQTIAGPSTDLVNASKAAARGDPNSKEVLESAATRLVKAVRDLVGSAASSKQEEVKEEASPEEQAQYTVLATASKAVATATSHLIAACRVASASGRSASAGVHMKLSTAAKEVSDSITALLNSLKGLRPGQVKCDEALEMITASVEKLDALALSATVGQLDAPAAAVVGDVDSAATEPSTDAEAATNKANGAQEELVAKAFEVSTAVSSLCAVAKTTPAEIGKAVEAAAAAVDALVTATEAVTSTTADPTSQKQIIGLSKQVADAVMGIVSAARAIYSGDEAGEVEMGKCAKDASEAIKNLVSTLKLGVAGARECDEAIRVIVTAAKELDEPVTSFKTTKSYQQCRDDLMSVSKVLVGVVNNVTGAAKTEISKVGTASRALAEAIPRLIGAAKHAVAASSSAKVKDDVISAAQAVAGTAKGLITSAKVVASNPKNANSQKKLQLASALMNDSVTKLLNSLSTGELDCETAVTELKSTIASLDAAALFATAGQLQPETADGVSLEQTQANLTAMGEALEKECAQMLESVKLTPEQLGSISRSVARVAAQMAADSKAVAAFVGDVSSQQAILTATKDVAFSAQRMAVLSRKAQAAPNDESTKRALADAAKSVRDAIGALIHTAKNASAEALASDKEIEVCRSEIVAVVRSLDDIAGDNTATAEGVVECAREVASSAAQLLAASASSQKDAVQDAAKSAAAVNRKLMVKVKGALRLTDDKEVKAKLLHACRAIAGATATLLDTVKTGGKYGKRATAAGETASDEIADKISELISGARSLKGGEDIVSIRPGDDLEELAEKELGIAAAAIEAAAEKLRACKPPPKAKDDISFEFSVADAIHEAASAITNATAMLVKSAVAVQKEVSSAKKKTGAAGGPALNKFYRKDSIWAEGLISASKKVATSVNHLVTTANNAVAGQASEEALVATAKQVAAATAQLVAASRSKADTENPNQKKLAESAKMVASATSQLVAAAKTVSTTDDEEGVDKEANSFTGSIVQEMEQQMKILQLEKQLEKAREAMKRIRKKNYES